MNKDRGLRTRKPLSTNIRIDLAEKLDQLSAETKINKSVLLDEAIELLLEKRKSAGS